MIQILTARLQPTLALLASSLAKEVTSILPTEIRVRTSVNLQPSYLEFSTAIWQELG